MTGQIRVPSGFLVKLLLGSLESVYVCDLDVEVGVGGGDGAGGVLVGKVLPSLCETNQPDIGSDSEPQQVVVRQAIV